MNESKVLEFKAEVTNSFLKTVSAYANFGTGEIMFGIRDDGTICGIADPQQTCLDIENRINDSISPKPDYTLSVNKRTKTITLTVYEGMYKPYLYKGKAYRRSDTASIETDRIELNRLTLEGANLYYEEQSSKVKAADFRCFEEKLQEKLGIARLTDDMLRTFGFYAKDGNLNYAAMLFADKNDFPGVDIARFGNSINEIMERKTVSGVSILKQYDEAVGMYHRYYQYEKIEGMERVPADLVPETAFREVIANALIHRTWDTNSHIRISMFADCIEIISPGGLPSGLSEEEYLNGRISSLRNPILGNIFFRLHYVEMFGTGIKRIKDAYRDAAHKPSFCVHDNSIAVSLPVTIKKPELSLDGSKIIRLLGQGTLLSSREIADALGWSKDKAVRIVNQLKNAGYIDTYGTGRGTKYKAK